MATQRRRRTRAITPRRLVAVGALVLVGLLYYRPLTAFHGAHVRQAESAAAVRRLQDEQATLKRRLDASSSLTVLAREARALGYVRPGEHLFIVKNIPAWRAAHTARRGR